MALMYVSNILPYIYIWVYKFYIYKYINFNSHIPSHTHTSRNKLCIHIVTCRLLLGNDSERSSYTTAVAKL
jgi:hypothetical protein